MSYRPANYLPSLYKRTGINVLVNSSYTSGVSQVKAETRYFDPNMILYLSVSSPNNGGIYFTSDDLMPNATIVSKNSNFTNVPYLFDHNGSTYAYDNGTSIANGAEQTEIVLNLGQSYTGFIYLNSWTSSSSYTERIYTSPDNSTWTKIIDVSGSSTPIVYVTGIQYVKLTYYNGSSSTVTASSSYWATNSLEFYPVPLRTSFQGDGTTKWYYIFVYNTYYELFEVWNI